MAIIINSVGKDKFNLNGKTYARIFQPLAIGLTHVALYNTYDTRLQISASKHFSEYVVNGTTYNSQTTLIQGLLNVVFVTNSSNNSGGGTWGSIIGRLDDQGDLMSALNGKEPMFSKKNAFNKNFGTTAGTVAQGNDSRFTDINSLTELNSGVLTTPFMQSAVNLNAWLRGKSYLNTSATAYNAARFGNLAVLDFVRTTGNFTQTITGGKTFTGKFIIKNSGAYPQIHFDNGTDERFLYRTGEKLVWRYDGINDGELLHTGKMGAGSGLDADLLDGLNSSDFMRITGNVTETVSGNKTFLSNVLAPAFFESSDKRLKTNIIPISKSFYSYELKKEKGKKRYGQIAQELEKTNPELVNTDDKGMKSVNYTDYLCLKLAEQENEIAELKAMMKELLNR